MTTDTRYNGWRNYETWVVNLWIGNEQNSYAYWQEEARDCWRHPAENEYIPSHRDRACIALADRLKERFEEEQEFILGESNMHSSVWADLLGAALRVVDWREIAEHWIDELSDEDKQQTDDTDAR